MASLGFPITVVTGLLLITGAALVLTPKDILRSSVVADRPTDYADMEVTASPDVLPVASTLAPVVQFASLTVRVTPLAETEIVGGELAVAPAAPQDVRWITASVLNMRTEPNKSSQFVTSLPQGTKVVVSDTSGTWAFVTAPDGSSGWLSQNFLTSTGPAD
jgi:uncharacterized protein YgiM (DUF1202 family)